MQTLHITNGDVMTERLLELSIPGDILTWNEMLCEGQTMEQLDSEAHINKRKVFFSEVYGLEFEDDKFQNDIDKLNHANQYTEVILWFEYDLFCHINLMAAISLLRQKHVNLPIYLVCSGRIEGEDSLKGLGELSQNQLLSHLKNKTTLKKSDLELAETLWGIYCGKDHNLFKPFILKKSSFQYLNSCLKAHLERFPSSVNGLSVLENNILQLIKDHDIKSRHHLLGYVLNYQGYYGYGDLQIERLIENLSIFFEETKDNITLNRKGHEALLGQHNFALELNNNIDFGGVNRLEYQFSKTENKLIKTPINAN
ncbi:DUF1835 domain-containing protein [Mangrovimonas cancribranchiae]|uniref:DUF1835 domain-containing protein n=1 Tax=Mangrovimonas cancribranchiae TaxID=3080055 RepID=A0AAU6P130_9FLAO